MQKHTKKEQMHLDTRYKESQSWWRAGVSNTSKILLKSWAWCPMPVIAALTGKPQVGLNKKQNPISKMTREKGAGGTTWAGSEQLPSK
jgi:hypothetical protein